MDRLHRMKEALMNCVEGQIVGHLDQADAKELGEAIDMIKDLSEAIYYCTITEAMKENEKDDKHRSKEDAYYYPARYYPYPMYYDDPSKMYYEGNGRSYYGNGGNSGGRGSNSGGRGDGNEGRDGNSQTAYYHDPMREQMMRDYREGRSGIRRKMYMEGKQNHHEKSKQIQELDNYMHELTSDITEMIQDASPEEKQMLQQKIATLATKIK